MIDREALELIAREALGADTPEYVEGRGVSFEAAGVACGNLARAAVESLGMDPLSADTRSVGGAITTAALCAFELGLRAGERAYTVVLKEAIAAMPDACGHDGWQAGCPACEANEAAATAAIEAA